MTCNSETHMTQSIYIHIFQYSNLFVIYNIQSIRDRYQYMPYIADQMLISLAFAIIYYN